jgi:uncharacterized protein YukJ
MPLERYGVLKGRPIGRRLGVSSNAHYQIHVIDDTRDYRIAVNVKSQLYPSELEYLIDNHFQHPIIADLPNLPLGFTPLESRPGGMALDFIRGNLFSREQMRPLPFDIPGPDNDLNEAIDVYVQQAMADEQALVYAFGERWGPEPQTKDKIFGFLPGNGIHDIHMNQGNVGRFVEQDGVWQDGALLIHFPHTAQWIGIFLKFQSQTWHTDDVNGHRIETDSGEPDGIVRIVAALVNPLGPAPEEEAVTLLNTSPQAIDLTGWAIADKQKRRHLLTGLLAPGGTMLVALPQSVQLGNKGGIITLLNHQDLKVDGVSYTEAQVKSEGWTVVF